MRGERDGGPERAQSAPIPAGIVAVLSLAVPGLGHLLLRMWLRGGIWLAGWVVIAALSGGHSLSILILMLFAAGDALFWGIKREREHGSNTRGAQSS